MSHNTIGLQLYSKYTDNKIGEAVITAAQLVRDTETYYEYAQSVQFRIDFTDEYRTKYTKWRIPKEGYGFWQFSNIENNNTGLVTVNCHHIMNGVYSHINSVHKAKIGGQITDGQLQSAGSPLSVIVSKNSDGSYQLIVNSGQFVFHFNPDSMTADNADEIFTTE
ncbi:MAG: hypothetical protein LBK82_16150 [Planctomycetaceae bacterium]|jgi:hypothetical protein|nr:hypothetical protein [Planctomycetaceae bacterium]